MSRLSALKMIKRRARKAVPPPEICAHSFRGTRITEHLRNGGDIEVAALIAGHDSSPVNLGACTAHHGGFSFVRSCRTTLEKQTTM